MAAFLIGPSEIFGIPEKVYITMIGFSISGMLSPWTIVPPYRELELCLDVYEDKHFDPEEV